MKNKSFILSGLIALLFLSLTIGAANLPKPVKNSAPSEFTGMWTIDIKGGGVGWLEVKNANNYLDGSILWQGGSVVPVTWMHIAGDVLYAGRDTRSVVREKDAQGNDTRSHMVSTWLEVWREGSNIKGFYLRPRRNGVGLDSTEFTGTLLPPVPAKPNLKTVKYGQPETLFNGKDLSGWRMVENNRANGWIVKDGVMINDVDKKEGSATVRYGNIRTEKEWKDFNLKLEVNVPAKSNSGIYLNGRYEIQVMDSYGKALDSHNMGGLYSRVTPSVAAEKPAGTWQSFDITLCDRHVTVILNGTTIIDNQPVYGPTGGALTADVFAPGPIYLQGDHGTVSFRNIVLTPIIK